jgi:hypothetical protein
MKRIFSLLFLCLFTVSSFAQTYPFTAGQKLTAAELNQAIATLHATAGTANNITITNSVINSSTGSFTLLSSPLALLTGGNVDGMCVGCNTRAAGYFTTLNAASAVTFSSNVSVVGILTISGVVTTWNISATSGVAANGYSYAVNTSAVPVTITLPASAPSSTVTMLDYAGTFATHNLTVKAPTGVNINGASGTPATLTVSTSWIKIICTYLDNTIGYRCY